MRKRSKSTAKAIEVVLNEEKFYFPGECLKGKVILHPKSPTKTNHIVLKFIGEVLLSIKDKETITLFQRTQILPVRQEKDASKVCVLEAKQHEFPFEFVVPEGLDLPSSMEYGKKCRVQYLLTAVHDRPMVPESFCAKAEYRVPILELLDIEAVQFTRPQEKTANVAFRRDKTSHLRVSMPRVGFTRGDIIPLGITVTHHEAAVAKKSLHVKLVRIVDIRTNKHSFLKEDVLRSTDYDINIIGPYNFSQLINCKLAIPTSTPPTIGFRGTVLRVYYQIRVKADLKTDDGRPINLSVNLPTVIGTWPRADIPIDDDYEDDLADDLNTMMIDVEESDSEEEKTANRRSGPTMFRTSYDFASIGTANTSRQSLLAGKRASLQMTSNIQTSQNVINEGVDRSDSNGSKSSKKSYGSVSSWHSRHSWESPASLSGNTSLSTALNLNDSPQTVNLSPLWCEMPLVTPATTGCPIPLTPSMPVKRGAQHQRSEATRAPAEVTSTFRQSGSYPSIPTAMSPLRSNFAKASSSPDNTILKPNHGNIVHSPTLAPPPPHLALPSPLPPITSDPVPTRILQPIPRPVPTPTISTSTPIFDNSSSDEISSDEDDLLHIVHKKKKQEASRFRKEQQQQMQQRNRPAVET